jgi:hypothetical protein
VGRYKLFYGLEIERSCCVEGGEFDPKEGKALMCFLVFNSNTIRHTHTTQSPFALPSVTKPKKNRDETKNTVL